MAKEVVGRTAAVSNESWRVNVELYVAGYCLSLEMRPLPPSKNMRTIQKNSHSSRPAWQLAEFSMQDMQGFTNKTKKDARPSYG